MRVLMVTPRFPYPPDRGDTLRSWTFLSGLAARHDVWLACVDRRTPAPEHLEPVQRICRDVAVATRSPMVSLVRGIVGMLRGQSLTESYFADGRLAQTLQRWARAVEFDGLLTFTSSIAPSVSGIPATRRVLDLCDVDSIKWQLYARRSAWPLKWFYRREARCVRVLESRVARQHDVTVLVNERERSKFAERVPSVVSAVAPTALSSGGSTPPTTQAELPARPIVGMVGSMFYPPNIRAVNWFGRHVWPRVRGVLPEAEWWIVGQRPAWPVRRWGRLPNVTVTGYVRDVQPYLAQMRVFVNAVDNDLGVQSKLIVAMAAGRPAVVTPRAAAGVDHDDPPPFIVVGSPTGFADAIVRILRDDAHARELSRRAQSAAQRYYSPAEAVARIECWLAGDQASSAARRSVHTSTAGLVCPGIAP